MRPPDNDANRSISMEGEFKMTRENYNYSESASRNGHGRAVVAGVLVGGLTGAITALLLAPQTGKETRSQIQGKVTDVRDRAGEKVEDALEQIRTRAQQLKLEVGGKAGELKAKGQDALVEQLDRVSAAADAGKKSIQAGRS
jgi:gas vesicle protein